MLFETPLVPGVLLRRYKRFLADVRLERGDRVTAHVPNTGSMLGCAEPQSPVALSHHPDKGRKLPWTLELVRSGEAWIGVNTARPNAIAAEAVAAGRLRPLRGYPVVRREVACGDSRVDLLLEDGPRRCWVEVKNVTLRGPGRLALFPDAVTTRGTRHLKELAARTRAGERAAMLYLVNRTDCTAMAPAREIDPDYAAALEAAARDGVELLAYRTRIDLEGIHVDRKVPVRL